MVKSYSSVDEMLETIDKERSKFDKFFDPLRYKIADIQNYIERRWKKPTTVKPSWLGHHWMDEGDLMPHLIFSVLDNFIKNYWWEDRYKSTEDDDPEQRAYWEKSDKEWQELKEHNDWFRTVYLPEFERDFINLPDDIDLIKANNKQQYYALLQEQTNHEIEIEKECTKRAMRIVELRSYLN